jgi:hypothetical protein
MVRCFSEVWSLEGTTVGTETHHAPSGTAPGSCTKHHMRLTMQTNLQTAAALKNAALFRVFIKLVRMNH